MAGFSGLCAAGDMTWLLDEAPGSERIAEPAARPQRPDGIGCTAIVAAPVGTRLGPYEIVAPLGAGGMGEVYRARDTRLGREVAVKVLPPHLLDSPEALARFEREARAVAALNHPHIVALHDVGREGTTAYAVTELLEGQTFRGLIAAGPVPPRRALGALAQVARGLGAAHERGIVHRDIKPENLFLTRDGRAKILDFGIATQEPASATTDLAGRMTQPGTLVGTPAYMAPEQLAARPATARSDIFAFGLVAHEMLAGAHPFQRKTPGETLAAVLRDDPAPLTGAGLPPAAARVLARCLEKDPAERPGSARDLGFFLDTLASAPEAQPPSASRRDVTPVVRRHVFLAALVAALASVALVWGYAEWVARRAGDAAVAADLTRAQRLVQRVQQERLAHLALTADLVAASPAIKALFGTDAATAHDFLRTQRALVAANPTLIALLPDGRVLARTDTAGPAPPAPSDTWMDALLTKDVGPTVVTIDGRLYHAARAVSEAGGNTFGHVVVAIPVDAAFGRLLADATQDEVVLLAGGVVATTLREGDTPWRSLQEWREAGGGTSGFTDASVGGRRYHAQEVALSAAPALSAIVARLRDDVTAPSREIQRGLPLVALASGALAVAAAWYAARRAARQGL